MKAITRKKFLAGGVAVLAGLAIGAGCSGGGDEDPAPGGDDDDDGQTGTPTPTPTATGTTTPTPTPTPSPSPTPFGNCMTNGTSVTITNPHGHTMMVPAADVTAGAQKVYDITGGALHGHTVTLTAAHFAQLQMNFEVSVTSSANGHTHSVTVRCVE